MLDGIKIDLQKRSLSEQVFQHIKRMIFSEELSGGERIPEGPIAQTFGVSRTPIREALRKLEKIGLVDIVPWSHANVVRLSQEDAKHICEARLALERVSVKLLAERSTAEDCTALHMIVNECEKFAKQGDMSIVSEKDIDLHLELARRCGNSYLWELLNNLAALIQLLHTTAKTNADSIHESIAGHRGIIDAVESREVSIAVELMQEHIENTMDRIA